MRCGSRHRGRADRGHQASFRLLDASSNTNDRTVFDYRCPECGQRGQVDRPERRNDLCGNCAAAVTWTALDPATQSTIDAAIRRGRILGLIAMYDALPPIRLPHAVDVLQYRHISDVRPDTDGT